MIGNPLMLGSADYQITRSLRFRSSASAYLSRTPGSSGNRKTFTISMWVKRSGIGGADPYYLVQAGSGTTESTWLGFAFDIDILSFGTWTTSGGATTAVYRDPSAWYHVVIAIDTTQATAANRVKIYVNGVQQAQSTPTITQNADLAWNNSGVVHYIGARVDSGPRHYMNGYIAEIHNIDGQALTPSSFGETDSVTGVWMPKKFTGTYGTNGFYLPFTDNSGATATTIGKDFSGNSNNWTPNNISVTSGETYDSMTDVPTLTSPTAANYCVLNPLSRFSTGGTLSNGNLTCALSSSTGNNKPTIGAPSGKWYAEFTISSLSGQSVDLSLVAASPDARSAKLRADYCSNGQTYNYGTSSYVSYGAGWAAGDVIGVAWDLDANQVTFYRNGTSQGTLSTPSLGTNASGGDVSFTINNSSSQSVTFSVNFGQRPFAYTPPSGFVALNTFNLPTPSIVDAGKHFDVALVTGSSSVAQVITVKFAPDFLWSKCRNNAVIHGLYDSVRGGNKYLSSNATDAETTTTGNIVTFNSNGATLQAGGSIINDAGRNYVDWLWKANGAGSTNTAGSITSTVSANTTSGFSVVTYTGNGTNGATVGHGLGVTPSLLIFKARGGTNNWVVTPGNSTLFGGSFYLQLNTDSAVISNSNIYTSYPSSSVFYLGTSGDVNTSSATYVAYCFAPIAGFSAFGSYTGNGSTDGPFIYTGFRPRWFMWKRTDSTANWLILDTSRDTYNLSGNQLFPNLSNAEFAGSIGDILSNGFKFRDGGASNNASGGTYIYAAFAENPFKYSLAR